MKIAIPVEDYETEICPSFGRAPMFLIYDTETKEKNCLITAALPYRAVQVSKRRRLWWTSRQRLY